MLLASVSLEPHDMEEAPHPSTCRKILEEKQKHLKQSCAKPGRVDDRDQEEMEEGNSKEHEEKDVEGTGGERGQECVANNDQRERNPKKDKCMPHHHAIR
mmetsp:Transcript_16222/g.44061  ORF Transcript_16222/g.44061 Transcript_16222/m.44061 type:complete len:100 (-) Transcript_16222:825-1124(-)